MVEKYLNIDLEDPRIGAVADVISNKSCKKILSLLSEKEMSESDIAQSLKMPLNTVGYNVKKLVEAGLIEKSQSFFWSVKGKKVPTYRLSNKKIVISPKIKVKGIIPTVIITGIIAWVIKIVTSPANKISDEAYSTSQAGESMLKSANYASDAGVEAVEAAPSFSSGIHNYITTAPDAWAWFFVGALAGMLIFLLWNWRKYVSK